MERKSRTHTTERKWNDAKHIFHLVSTGNVIRLVLVCVCVVCVFSSFEEICNFNYRTDMANYTDWSKTDKPNWAWRVQISHYQIENVFQCNWIIYIRYHKWGENARGMLRPNSGCVCVFMAMNFCWKVKFSMDFLVSWTKAKIDGDDRERRPSKWISKS